MFTLTQLSKFNFLINIFIIFCTFFIFYFINLYCGFYIFCIFYLLYFHYLVCSQFRILTINFFTIFFFFFNLACQIFGCLKCCIFSFWLNHNFIFSQFLFSNFKNFNHLVWSQLYREECTIQVQHNLKMCCTIFSIYPGWNSEPPLRQYI